MRATRSRLPAPSKRSLAAYEIGDEAPPLHGILLDVVE